MRNGGGRGALAAALFARTAHLSKESELPTTLIAVLPIYRDLETGTQYLF